MSHAHSPENPPHTIEELTRDIDAVEQASDKAAGEDRFLKPSADGIGCTLGVDLKTPQH